MATFNPQTNYDRVPDTLNYSKGYKTGAGVVGDALSQTAEVLDSKIKATDRAFAQMATDETRIAVEQTDARLLGVGDKTNTTDPLDAEVRKQVRNLSSKKQAMEAGSLSPEHYYATVQAKVKEIRTRYSGYNEQIDEELKRVGIDPNWQRKQILEAAAKAADAANAKANELDKNNRELVEYALKNTMLSPSEQAQLIPEGSWRDPKIMLFVKSRIARDGSMKASLEFNRLEAERANLQNKDEAKVAAEGYNKELQTNLAFVVGRSVDFKQLQTSLATMNKKIAAGESPSSEETTALIGRINLIKQEMNKIKLAAKANYATAAPFITEEMKKADELFDSTIDGIADGLTNQKTGLLSFHTNRLNAIMNGKQLNIVQGSDALATLSAYKERFGENLTNTIAARNLEQAKDAADADFRNSAMIDLGVGKLKSVRQSLAHGSKPENFDSKATKELLNNMLSTLEDPATLPNGRIAYLNGFYNEDNKALWDLMFTGKNLSEDEKQAYFNRLTSPKIIKAISETGDVNIINNFSDTVSYLATKANTLTGNDLMAIRTSSTSTDIAWDEKTGRFTLVKRADPTVNPTYRFLNSLGAKLSELSGSEQQVVNRINTSITAIRNTADLLGIDKDQATGQFLRGLGIDVNAPKAGGLLERTDKKNNEYIKKKKDEIKGGASNDTLSDVTFNRSMVSDATANTEGELTSRTPSTRDKVMEFLTGLGVPTEQASTMATGVETIVGPANTPQDAALAALTVIPGGAIPGMAKTAVRPSLGLVEGGLTKLESLVKTLPNMTMDEIKAAEGALAKEMRTVGFDDTAHMNNIIDRGGAIAAEKANRAAKAAEVPKGLDAVKSVPKERLDSVDQSLRSNVVSLDNVRTAKEAFKVADDLDADAAKAIAATVKTNMSRDKEAHKILSRLEKKMPQLKNLVQNDPSIGDRLAILTTRASQYADASAMLQRNVERMNDVGMAKGLKKIQDDLTNYQVKALEEITSLADELLGKIGPRQVK